MFRVFCMQYICSYKYEHNKKLFFCRSRLSNLFCFCSYWKADSWSVRVGTWKSPALSCQDNQQKVGRMPNNKSVGTIRQCSTACFTAAAQGFKPFCSFCRSAEALSPQNVEGRQKQSVNTQVHTHHTWLQHKHTCSQPCDRRRLLAPVIMKSCADNLALKSTALSAI